MKCGKRIYPENKKIWRGAPALIVTGQGKRASNTLLLSFPLSTRTLDLCWQLTHHIKMKHLGLCVVFVLDFNHYSPAFCLLWRQYLVIWLLPSCSAVLGHHVTDSSLSLILCQLCIGGQSLIAVTELCLYTIYGSCLWQNTHWGAQSCLYSMYDRITLHLTGWNFLQASTG